MSKSGALEHKTMVAIKHHVTVRNKSEKNSLLFTPENVAGGRGAFGRFCGEPEMYSQ